MGLHPVLLEHEIIQEQAVQPTSVEATNGFVRMGRGTIIRCNESRFEKVASPRDSRRFGCR